MHRNVSGQPDS